MGVQGNGREEALSVGGGDQRNPRVDGSYVIWLEPSASPTHNRLVLYDKATRETRVVTQGPVGFYAGISGDYVVWIGSGSKIYLHKISSGSSFPIAEGNNCDIDGDHVVYVNTRNGNRDIYVYTISTGEETAVCTDPAEQDRPAVHGDHIVWQDGRDNTTWPSIYMYTFSTGHEERIPIGTGGQADPDIWGDNIVYENFDDLSIHLFSISKQIEVRISETFPVGHRPIAIWGDRIVWIQWDRVIGKGKGVQNVHLYKISEGKEFAVSNIQENASRRWTPDISGSMIVWMDNRAGNYDIWSYVIGEGPNSPPVIELVTVNPREISPGGLSCIDVRALDTDHDLLQYHYEATGGVVSGQGSSVDWIAPETEGLYSIEILVSDGKGGTASAVATINVLRAKTPPVAILKSMENTVPVGDKVVFEAFSSYDPDGSVVECYYDFGDGKQHGWTIDFNVFHTYTRKDVYYARLKVRDNDGLESEWSDPVQITVGEPRPQIQLTLTIGAPESGFARTSGLKQTVRVTLEDQNHRRVPGSQMLGVTARFSTGDGDLNLVDTGTPYDGEANDGVYAVVWTPRNTGSCTITMIARHSSGTTTESRVTGTVRSEKETIQPSLLIQILRPQMGGFEPVLIEPFKICEIAVMCTNGEGNEVYPSTLECRITDDSGEPARPLWPLELKPGGLVTYEFTADWVPLKIGRYTVTVQASHSELGSATSSLDLETWMPPAEKLYPWDVEYFDGANKAAGQVILFDNYYIDPSRDQWFWSKIDPMLSYPPDGWTNAAKTYYEALNDLPWQSWESFGAFAVEQIVWKAMKELLIKAGETSIANALGLVGYLNTAWEWFLLPWASYESAIDYLKLTGQTVVEERELPEGSWLFPEGPLGELDFSEDEYYSISEFYEEFETKIQASPAWLDEVAWEDFWKSAWRQLLDEPEDVLIRWFFGDFASLVGYSPEGIPIIANVNPKFFTREDNSMRGWVESKGFLAQAESPVDLHLFDESNRHVGPIYNRTDGTVLSVESQIPGVFYSGPETHPEVLLVTGSTADQDFRLVVKGLDEGDYTILLVYGEEGATKIFNVSSKGEPGKNDTLLLTKTGNSLGYQTERDGAVYTILLESRKGNQTVNCRFSEIGIGKNQTHNLTVPDWGKLGSVLFSIDIDGDGITDREWSVESGQDLNRLVGPSNIPTIILITAIFTTLVAILLGAHYLRSRNPT